MEINKFIEDFEQQFESIEVGSVKPDSIFRNIKGWDSLTAMLVIDMMSEKYNTVISAEDLRKCQTVIELYKLTLNNNA
ncbi:MAG: acyl carrier protein [Cyclobacteriaceae bacterium]|nr:acyl carrier protein [Cyclobacteriaceae bacterium]